jgi:two-component system sensor histidine kinase CpxA
LVKTEQVVGASGRRYTFLVVIPPLSVRSFLNFLGRDELLRLAVGLLLAGVFCFWLARHITAPLMRLRQATNKIEAGDLSARACAGRNKRKDEIGLLSQQFDQMAERVESLLSDHKRLLSTVSHELRSPLTRLSVAAALLRLCPEEEKLEYVNRIELETEQLNKMISQLLALSRIESGVDARARQEPVDLVSLVQEVAADGNFEAQARSRSVAVGTLDPCVASGIADQIRGAIENVVRNAIRHTRANSEVEISMRRQEEAPTTRAVVQVRDHGPGVPEADLKKIFLPFYRVSSSEESDSDGSGLGLAIAERVARMHGGAVRAINAPGGGLLVELELPVS